jgi:hypothetical protein
MRLGFTPRLTEWLAVSRNVTLTLPWMSSFMLSRVKAGSNTSTVTLRVVGGDEKRSLESETVKYGQKFYRTRTRKWLRWRGPATIVNYRLVLSSERASHINKSATV